MTVQDIRYKHNLTQKALSDLTGIPKRTIENWEEGHRTPPEYIVRLIAYFVDHEVQK